MPFCARCRSEYRSGFTTCADCGAPLVVELPPEPPHPDDWMRIFTTSSELQATLVQGLIESADVECHSENLKFHANPVDLSRLSEIRLFVREKDVEQARRILSETEDSLCCSRCGLFCSGEDKICPECGEAFEN